MSATADSVKLADRFVDAEHGASGMVKTASSSPFYIGLSTIHGKGVFTSVPVTKGTILWSTAEDNHIEVTQVQLAFLGELFGTDFLATFSKYAFLSSRKVDSVWVHTDEFSYMNHSSTPNTAFDGNDVVATRDIAADTELTEDYDLSGYRRQFCAAFLASAL
jgi:SET domain-containing protein